MKGDAAVAVDNEAGKLCSSCTTFCGTGECRKMGFLR